MDKTEIKTLIQTVGQAIQEALKGADEPCCSTASEGGTCDCDCCKTVVICICAGGGKSAQA